jgi:hypothetical protein
MGTTQGAMWSNPFDFGWLKLFLTLLFRGGVDEACGLEKRVAA